MLQTLTCYIYFVNILAHFRNKTNIVNILKFNEFCKLTMLNYMISLKDHDLHAEIFLHKISAKEASVGWAGRINTRG